MAQLRSRAGGSSHRRPGRYWRRRVGAASAALVSGAGGGAVAWRVPRGHATASGLGPRASGLGPRADTGVAGCASGAGDVSFRIHTGPARGEMSPARRHPLSPAAGRFLGLEALRMVGSTHSTRIQTPKPGFDPYPAGCVGGSLFPCRSCVNMETFSWRTRQWRRRGSVAWQTRLRRRPRLSGAPKTLPAMRIVGLGRRGSSPPPSPPSSPPGLNRRTYNSWRRNVSHVVANSTGTSARLKSTGPMTFPASSPSTSFRAGSPTDDGM
jgi:hypothetical protein